MKQLTVLLLFVSLNLTFGQIPNTLSNEEKVFGLSKFWQEVNYSFIYFNKINQTEWNELYKEYIGKVQKTKNDYDYYRLLQKFCAYLKDGHTNVYFPKEIQDSIFNTNFGEYRLFLKNIDSKAIIIRVNDSKKKEIPITYNKPKKSRYSRLIIENPITGDNGNEIRIKSLILGNTNLPFKVKSLFLIK